MYFRVGFYSKVLREASGKEFIYKQSADTQISDFKARLIQVHQKESKIPVEVENSLATPNKESANLILHISQVEPFYDDPPFTFTETITNICRTPLQTSP